MKMPVVLAKFSYPMLEELNLGNARLDDAQFADIIQKCPKLKRLTWPHHYNDQAPTTYTGEVCESLQSMNLKSFSNYLIRSLVQKCPNLKRLEFGLREFEPYYVVDQIFDHCEKVEILAVDFVTEHDGFGELVSSVSFHQFWALSSLRSLEFSPTITDPFVIKLAKSFHNLESLSLYDASWLSNACYTSLPVLLELRRLVIGRAKFGSRNEKGIRQLAQFGRLEEVDFSRSSHLSATTFLCLIRQCPNLRYLGVQGIKEAEEGSTAIDATTIRSLVGRKRDLEIVFRVVPEAWNSSEVKMALEEINRINGCTIRTVSKPLASSVSDESCRS